MRLVDIITRERIACNVEVASKKRALELASEITTKGTMADSKTVFECLVARERLGSTGIGHGVALPHGRIPNQDESVGSLIKLKSPVPFDAIDDQPVDLIFTLLVPEEATDQHLHLLSQLAEIFSHQHIRDGLRRANDEDMLYNLVTEYGHNA